MPTEEQKDRAAKLQWYLFIALFIVAFLSLVIAGIRNNMQPSAKIFMIALWLMFATGNVVHFYTGRFKWKGGPTFTREESPTLFYASAIFWLVASMGIATFLVWGVYQFK